ncbi:MAG: aspartate carbamoyltransferase regulatory subunit [Methanobrevibacter sp.]|jgi:aspartate carbamoyltransferase regulatory subunit|nr:aspartate carbamoyltransferase regulatory subunit [Candidatus Methanovirga basalitermitum]
MKKSKNHEMKVKQIKDGTVIDHITSNKSLYLLRILGLPNKDTSVTIAMNVSSNAIDFKDIVKIENRELKPSELDQVALISPNATINIIRNYNIVIKEKIKFRNELNSIIKCTNQRCVTNTNEPIESRFKLVKKMPIVLRCYYCDRLITAEEIKAQFY